MYSLYIGVSGGHSEQRRSAVCLGALDAPQNPRKPNFGDPQFLGLGPRSPLKFDFRGLWGKLRPLQDAQESSDSLDFLGVVPSLHGAK